MKALRSVFLVLVGIIALPVVFTLFFLAGVIVLPFLLPVFFFLLFLIKIALVTGVIAFFCSHRFSSYVKMRYAYSLPARWWVTKVRDNEVFDEGHVVTMLHKRIPLIVSTQDMNVSWKLRLTGEEDWGIAKLLSRLVRPEQTVIEVGALFGAYTLPLAQKVGEKGHVFAFEPNPHVAPYLMASIARNGLEDRIDVRTQALSNHLYTGKMVCNIADPSSSYILPEKHTYTGKMAIPIKVSTLDDQFPKEKVDFVKIRAGGAEPLILQGAFNLLKRNKAHIIVLTAWNLSLMRRFASDPTELLQELDALGFFIWKVSPGGHLEGLTRRDLLRLSVGTVIFSAKKLC